MTQEYNECVEALAKEIFKIQQNKDKEYDTITSDKHVSNFRIALNLLRKCS